MNVIDTSVDQLSITDATTVVITIKMRSVHASTREWRPIRPSRPTIQIRSTKGLSHTWKFLQYAYQEFHFRVFLQMKQYNFYAVNFAASSKAVKITHHNNFQIYT